MICAAVLAVLDATVVRQAVSKALALSGWDCEEAVAEQIGISVSRLSKQLNGHDPLTFLARAHQLDGFWPALLVTLSEPCGALLIQHTDLKQLVVGLADLQRRVMAKASLDSGREMERVG